MLTNKKISIVIPCYNEELNIMPLYRRLRAVLDEAAPDYEIIYIENASRDNSEQTFRELAAKDKRVKVLLMSRPFQTEPSYDAGLHHASGACVVCMDGDQQDPPELIKEMLVKWNAGFEVIYGVRHKQEGNVQLNAMRRIFYKLLKAMSYIEVPLDAGDFCLYDARVARLLTQMPERSRFTRGLRAWIGFRHTGVEYTRDERSRGTSSQSLHDIVRTAMLGIFSFSNVPLELISLLALTSMGLAFIGILVHLGIYFFNGVMPRGFATMITAVFFMGGVQLLSLSIIGQYLGKIFEEVKQRPRFIVRETLN